MVHMLETLIKNEQEKVQYFYLRILATHEAKN